MESFIEIRGAGENNLKDVSLRAPKRKIPSLPACPALANRRLCSTDKHKKVSKFTRAEMELLLHGKPQKVKMRFGKPSRIHLLHALGSFVPRHDQLVIGTFAR